jgi:hypothetical protein
MLDATETAAAEWLREANQNLASSPFYIGTTRRQVVGIGLVVHLNLEHGAVVGFVSADLQGQPQQEGQQHPLTTTLIAIRGEDRERVLSEGRLDGTGRYPIPGITPQSRYYLHLGAE